MHRTHSAASAPNSINCLCAKALAQQHTAEFSDGCGDLQAVPRPGPWCRGSGRRVSAHVHVTEHPGCSNKTCLSTEKESMICSEFFVLYPNKTLLVGWYYDLLPHWRPPVSLGLSRKAYHTHASVVWGVRRFTTFPLWCGALPVFHTAFSSANVIQYLLRTCAASK